MSARSKKAHRDVHPITQTIVENVDTLLKERRLSRKELAMRAGIPPSELSKYLRIPRSNYKTIPAHYLFLIAEALGTSPVELAGIRRQRTQIWDPRTHEAQSFLALVAEHSDETRMILSFNRILLCSLMTPTVQELHYLSMLEPFISADESNRAIVDTYNQIGHARRRMFLHDGSDSKPQMVSLMLRSDFERLIRRQPPFDRCSIEDVSRCLEHLRTGCVDHRGVLLGFVNDANVPAHLRLDLELDSTVVIGKALTAHRTLDHRVSFTEDARQFDAATKMLRQLAKCVDHDLNKRACLTQLDSYLKQFELAERKQSQSRPA